METAFEKNVNLNNLQSKLLKQRWEAFLTRWAPLCSSLGTIL